MPAAVLSWPRPTPVAVAVAVELEVAAERIREEERTRWPERAAELVALVMGMALVKEQDRA